MLPIKPARFEYVIIPADTLYPIVAQDFDQVELEDDKFIKMMKEYFAMASPECSVDREMLMAQLNEHAKKDIASTIDSDILKNVLSMTSIDIMSISLPNKENSFVGVSLYCDDKGKSKRLQVNDRANGLIASCGLAGQSLNGDVFLSRMYDDGEDHWFRMTFGMADVSSSAEWVKRTARQMRGKVNANMPSLSSLAESFSNKTGSGSAETVSIENAPQLSGETASYKWFQTDEEVEVSIPAECEKKEVSVELKQKSILVTVKGEVIIQGNFAEPIALDESTWTFAMKDKLVQISLSKKTTGKVWSGLLA